MTTIDDLLEWLAIREENARRYLEDRCDADREWHIANKAYIFECREADRIRDQITRRLAEDS